MIWLHDCPKVVDNYGPQVVEKGEKCPFCGMNEEQAVKIVDESVAYGMDCTKGVCEH
jgi:hypothetical protein